MERLIGEKQALPGVGEKALVTLRGPAALADQQLVELGGVGGPDDIGGLVGVQAQRRDGARSATNRRMFAARRSAISVHRAASSGSSGAACWMMPSTRAIRGAMAVIAPA
jgi:hypothetical protein